MSPLDFVHGVPFTMIVERVFNHGRARKAKLAFCSEASGREFAPSWSGDWLYSSLQLGQAIKQSHLQSIPSCIHLLIINF